MPSPVLFPFDLDYLYPDRLARRREAEARKEVYGLERQVQRNVGVMEAFEAQHSDERLQEMATEAAYQDLGESAAHEDLVARAKAHYEKLKSMAQAQMEANRSGYERAVTRGLNALPDRPPEETPQLTPGPATRFMEVLSLPGRTAVAPITGMLEAAQQAAPAPVELDAEQGPSLVGDILRAGYGDTSGLMRRGLAKLKPDDPNSFAAKAWGAVDTIAGIPLAPGAMLSRMGEAFTQERPTVLGVDARRLTSKIEQDPRVALDIVKGGVNAVQRTWKLGLEDPGLAGPLTARKEQLEEKATELAYRDFGEDAPQEKLVARAQDYYTRLSAQDMLSWHVDHPVFADFVASIGLDPLNFASGGIAKAGEAAGRLGIPGLAKVSKFGVHGALPGAAIGTAGGSLIGSLIGAAAGGDAGLAIGSLAGILLRTEKVGGPAKDLLLKLTKHVRWGAWLDPFTHGKDPVLQEAASKLRASEDIINTATGAFVDDTLNVLGDVGQFSKTERAEIMHILEGRNPAVGSVIVDPATGKLVANMDAVPEKYRKFFTALVEEVDAAKWGLMEKSGLTRRISETGEVEEATRRSAYTPHRVFEQKDSAEQAVDIINARNRTQLKAKAAQQRGGPSPKPVQDPALQRYVDTLDVAPKASAALKLKEMRRIMTDVDQWKEIDLDAISESIGRKATSADLDSIAAGLSAKKGIEYKWIGPGAEDKLSQAAQTLQRITDPDVVGKALGKKVYFLPSPIAEQASEIIPIIDSTVGKAGTAKTLSEVANTWLNPFITMWKLTHTVGGHVGFAMPNATSSVGLATLGMGAKAANPAIHLGAVGGAIAAAFATPEVASKALGKIQWTLANGQKTTLAQVYEIYKKLGYGQRQVMARAGDVSALREASAMARGGSTAAIKARAALAALPQVTMGVLSASPTQVASALRPVPGLGRVAGAALQAGEAIGERLPAAVRKPLQAAGTAVQTVSPANVAAMSEDYQHFVTFLGFLDDASEAGIARAADLTAKYSANYARLTPFEQSALNNTFGFYTWMKFAGTRLLQATIEDPARLANFIKAREAIRKDRPQNTYGWEAIPPYLRNSYLIAAQGMQPGDVKAGDPRLAIQLVEDPFTMIFRSIQPLLGSEMPRDEQLAGALGPMLQGAIEYATGRDLSTGQEFDKTGQSWIGNQLYGILERPSEALLNLAALYRESGRVNLEADLWMRYKAQRDWFGLQLLLPGRSMEDLGIPGLQSPEDLLSNPLSLVSRTYLVEPYREMGRTKRAAMEAWLGEAKAGSEYPKK